MTFTTSSILFSTEGPATVEHFTALPLHLRRCAGCNAATTMGATGVGQAACVSTSMQILLSMQILEVLLQFGKFVHSSARFWTQCALPVVTSTPGRRRHH
jgi:hypothetical protein